MAPARPPRRAAPLCDLALARGGLHPPLLEKSPVAISRRHTMRYVGRRGCLGLMADRGSFFTKALSLRSARATSAAAAFGQVRGRRKVKERQCKGSARQWKVKGRSSEGAGKGSEKGWKVNGTAAAGKESQRERGGEKASQREPTAAAAERLGRSGGAGRAPASVARCAEFGPRPPAIATPGRFGPLCSLSG